MANLELSKTSDIEIEIVIIGPGVASSGNLLLEWLGFCVSRKLYLRVHDGDLLAKAQSASLCAPPLPDAPSVSLRDRLVKARTGCGVHDGDLLVKAQSASLCAPPLRDARIASLRDLLAKALPGCGVRDGDLLARAHSASPWAPPFPDAHSASLYALRSFLWTKDLLATILFSQGESSGSGGRAREGINGGGGNGNQGIGGGVGGGGAQREGIGNERRSNRGRNHGGGNGSGDDDGNGRGGWLGYMEGERGPIGPGPHRLAEILLFLNAQMIGTLESLDIHGLPPRSRIFRVVSLGLNSVALVCLSASIGHRRTSPRFACTLCWMGAFATLLGFSSMISMAFSASFIP